MCCQKQVTWRVCSAQTWPHRPSPGSLKQALPWTPPHSASQSRLPRRVPREARDQHPCAGLSPRTQRRWGPLPAKPGEVVHGMGEGGDRRGSGRALRGPHEAMSSQLEAQEVAGTLGVTAHAGRTESRARRGLRLGQLHRGGVRRRPEGGPGAGRRRAQLAGMRWGAGPGWRGGKGGRKSHGVGAREEREAGRVGRGGGTQGPATSPGSL